VSRDPHQERLMAAASKLGVSFDDLYATHHLDLVRYTYQGRSEFVGKGRVFSHLNAIAERICDDKHACKRVLSRVGIPVPEGIRFTDPTSPEVIGLIESAGNWVCKPIDGTHGEGVHMGLTTRQHVLAACENQSPGTVFVLENEVQGDDLRLQSIGGKLVAACRREPPRIEGDGSSTVQELVDGLRARVRSDNPANDFVVDSEVRSFLDREGLKLPDVVAKGRFVQLRSVANMATGARAVDLTDELHPEWRHLLSVVGETLGIRVFAVDAVTPDPTVSPFEKGAVIEVNARPEWMHHTFSHGRRHDIPRLLLEDLFGPLCPT